MSETTELTYADVSSHSGKKDLYVVVHDKVYDATKFVDEHPGGEEVLLDVGGQDATEPFEDVGHSDEAREILDGLLVGKLKRVPGDPAPAAASPPAPTSTASKPESAGMGVGLYALVLVGGIVAFGAYKYLQMNSESSK
ncbi:cytochrome b5-like heme/steroid binding domain-containing protein [Usnea florida]